MFCGSARIWLCCELGSASRLLSAPGLHLIHTQSAALPLYEVLFIQHTHTHTHAHDLKYGRNYENKEVSDDDEEEDACKYFSIVCSLHLHCVCKATAELSIRTVFFSTIGLTRRVLMVITHAYINISLVMSDCQSRELVLQASSTVRL